MKKYTIVLMSLMIASMVQVDASWRKPATIATAAASAALARYYGLNQNQPSATPEINVPNINVAANQPLYPNALWEYNRPKGLRFAQT